MSTFSAWLWDATVLANLGYRCYDAAGPLAARQTSGITQPDASYPLFLFSATLPAGTLVVIVNDSTQAGNATYIPVSQIGDAEGLIPAPTATTAALVKIQAAVYDSATVSGDVITLSNGATVTKTGGNRVTA